MECCTVKAFYEFQIVDGYQINVRTIYGGMMAFTKAKP